MMADQLHMSEKKHCLLFSIRRSVRYHHRRTRFFDSVNKVSTILAALGGSATIATVLSKAGSKWAILFAIIVAVSSAIDLVIGTAQKARLHNDLARRFFELEKEIVAGGEELSDSDIDRLTVDRLTIEADEPPPLKVLDSICHNELLRAMGYNEDCGDYVTITAVQRLFRHFFDYREHTVRRQVQDRST